MGTSISIKQLLNSWKTVVIALVAMAGLTIFILVIGRPVIGREATFVASPVLAGGIMAALIMQEAALAKGLTDLGTLAILVLVAQGFIGYPLTALFLRKEGENLITKYRSLSSEEREKLLTGPEVEKGDTKAGEKSIVPKKYRSENMYLFQAAVLVFIGVKVSGLTGGTLPATPQMVAQLIIPLLVVGVTGVVGLAIFSIPVGKIFGFSRPYSIALGLNCLLGFPPDMLITNDVSRALAKNEEEENYLNETMLPEKLIAGFTTVSIGSVVLAGIFSQLL